MYISSTYYLSIDHAFLNGDEMDNNNVTQVKKYQIKGQDYPYVSAQAFRKWLRSTVNFITDDPSYYDRVSQKSPSKSQRKKPEGLWIDPIHYIEDDLFGYSHPFLDIPDETPSQELSVSVSNRLSPFQSTALVGLPNSTKINTHDGWVKPIGNTSLPFATEMMSGIFEGSSTLDLDRIGTFKEYGDVVELDPFYKTYYLDKGKLIQTNQGNQTEYKLDNLKNRRIEVLKLYSESLLNLYGAAKSTTLATDLSPRIFIITGLKSANNLFYKTISTDNQGNLIFDSTSFLELLDNWSDNIKTHVYFGIRSGFLPKRVEETIKSLHEHEINGTCKILVNSPGASIRAFTEEMEGYL